MGMTCSGFTSFSLCKAISVPLAMAIFLGVVTERFVKACNAFIEL